MDGIRLIGFVELMEFIGFIELIGLRVYRVDRDERMEEEG